MHGIGEKRWRHRVWKSRDGKGNGRGAAYGSFQSAAA